MPDWQLSWGSRGRSASVSVWWEVGWWSQAGEEEWGDDREEEQGWGFIVTS